MREATRSRKVAHVKLAQRRSLPFDDAWVLTLEHAPTGAAVRCVIDAKAMAEFRLGPGEYIAQMASLTYRAAQGAWSPS